MPYVTLDYRDGAYAVAPLTDDEADRLMQQGHEVVCVEDRVLTAWLAHCDQAAAFNTMWRALDNELALRIKLMEKPR
jgi:hypothetical protein